MEQLIRDFAEVINRHSLENDSDTPDYILAQYLVRCLVNYQSLMRARNTWYGGKDEKGISVHSRRDSRSVFPFEEKVG